MSLVYIVHNSALVKTTSVANPIVSYKIKYLNYNADTIITYNLQLYSARNLVPFFSSNNQNLFGSDPLILADRRLQRSRTSALKTISGSDQSGPAGASFRCLQLPNTPFNKLYQKCLLLFLTLFGAFSLLESSLSRDVIKKNTILLKSISKCVREYES